MAASESGCSTVTVSALPGSRRLEVCVVAHSREGALRAAVTSAVSRALEARGLPAPKRMTAPRIHDGLGRDLDPKTLSMSSAAYPLTFTLLVDYGRPQSREAREGRGQARDQRQLLEAKAKQAELLRQRQELLQALQGQDAEGGAQPAPSWCSPLNECPRPHSEVSPLHVAPEGSAAKFRRTLRGRRQSRLESIAEE